MRKIKSDLDIQLIGSDISLSAVDTAINNMNFADIDKLIQDEVIRDPKER